MSEIFARLIELDADARGALLRDCDADMRAKLERLLAADASHDDPIERSITHEARVLARAAARGARFGPWRVLRELGAGGMGAVLLAERADGQFEQQVAIKLIRGFPTEDGQRRLRQERQILAQLDHPNIAHLLDGGESDDGQPYVVMEFVDGVPLLDYVAAWKPDLRTRLELFDKVASAVQHAHERLVIHRDLKPGNVLVRDDGEPRLLDFGVAKLVDLSAASDPRQTSTRVWTPGYASPEQESGALVTTASDVYALAVLLREMLTGERAPGTRGTLPEGFRPLPLDAELRGILEHAGAHEPRARYPTVEAFRADLQRWRDGRPVRAAPDTPFYRARKFVRRHRVGATLVVLALIATGAFVWRLDAERSRALDAEAAAEREAANARAAVAFLADALESTSPDRALSAQISVRDLLDGARERLETDFASQPSVRQSMQRLLGSLYMSLGEPRIALDLYDAGLKDVVADSRAAALQLATDEDGRSSALGSLERGEESLAAAERAQALRERWAPDDAIEQLRSLDQLAYAHYRSGDSERAIALMEQVIARAKTLPDAPVDVVTNSYQALANVLVERGEYERPLQIVEEGARYARDRLAPHAPEHVLLQRARAHAYEQAGRLSEAEAVMRETIALQERVVGASGHRMALLVNGLGTILNQMGRYREAAELMTRARGMSQQAQNGSLDDAIAVSNIGSVYENAGDYVEALARFDEAVAIVEAHGDPGASPRVMRTLLRNRARTLALMGRHAEAREALQSLRPEVAAQDGEDSPDMAFLVWQLAVVARRAREPDIGEPLLEECRRRFAALLPEGHPVFAHMRRAAASFLRDRGDLVGAEREQRAALAALEADEAFAIDVAIARAELAALLAARGDRRAARVELDAALPKLRASLLPTEVSRAEAEVLDAALSGAARGGG